jgi:c-di-GMP-binding flagellar brake protein YcgR
MVRPRLPGWPRPAKRKQAERRASVRFSPAQEIICYCDLGQGYVRARVCDLSAGGGCVLVKQRVEPGTIVSLELVNEAHTFLCARQMMILRVFQGSGSEAVIAGEFDQRLDYDELLPFIL